MIDEMISRPLRSALFVPGDKPRAIEKAASLGADALILDLEDAVAPNAKPAARAVAPQAIARFREGGSLAVIRIAAPGDANREPDLEAVIAARPDAVLVAKVEDPDTLAPIRDRLDRAGLAIPLWAMVETARSVVKLDAFMAANSKFGVQTLVAGVNDLAADLRLPTAARRSGCIPHLARLVVTARAAGMRVLDGVYNAYQDAAGFKAEAEAGRALGFDGKTLIHPSQVAPANRAFGPDAEELAWARAVEAAFADPANAGKGAVALDGEMVEAMHLARARAVLAAAGETGG